MDAEGGLPKDEEVVWFKPERKPNSLTWWAIYYTSGKKRPTRRRKGKINNRHLLTSSHPIKYPQMTWMSQLNILRWLPPTKRTLQSTFSCNICMYRHCIYDMLEFSYHPIHMDCRVKLTTSRTLIHYLWVNLRSESSRKENTIYTDNGFCLIKP